jgi:hypothetical protein
MRLFPIAAVNALSAFPAKPQRPGFLEIWATDLARVVSAMRSTISAFKASLAAINLSRRPVIILCHKNGAKTGE